MNSGAFILSCLLIVWFYTKGSLLSQRNWSQQLLLIIIRKDRWWICGSSTSSVISWSSSQGHKPSISIHQAYRKIYVGLMDGYTRAYRKIYADFLRGSGVPKFELCVSVCVWRLWRWLYCLIGTPSSFSLPLQVYHGEAGSWWKALGRQLISVMMKRRGSVGHATSSFTGFFFFWRCSLECEPVTALQFDRLVKCVV